MTVEMPGGKPFGMLLQDHELGECLPCALRYNLFKVAGYAN
jgi:hypothetical protein